MRSLAGTDNFLTGVYIAALHGESRLLTGSGTTNESVRICLTLRPLRHAHTPAIAVPSAMGSSPELGTCQHHDLESPEL
jgi:hypothetical protein